MLPAGIASCFVLAFRSLSSPPLMASSMLRSVQCSPLAPSPRDRSMLAISWGTGIAIVVVLVVVLLDALVGGVVVGVDVFGVVGVVFVVGVVGLVLLAVIMAAEWACACCCFCKRLEGWHDGDGVSLRTKVAWVATKRCCTSLNLYEDRPTLLVVVVK